MNFWLEEALVNEFVCFPAAVVRPVPQDASFKDSFLTIQTCRIRIVSSRRSGGSLLYGRVELILKILAAENKADKKHWLLEDTSWPYKLCLMKCLQADGLKEKPAWVGGGQVS